MLTARCLIYPLLLLAANSLLWQPCEGRLYANVTRQEDLLALLLNNNVTHIRLLKDMVFSAHLWNSVDDIHITRNVTLIGANITTAGTPLTVFDTNYTTAKLKLAKGLRFSVENVELRRTRRGLINRLDFIWYSPGSIVSLHNVAIHAPLCAPLSMLLHQSNSPARPRGFEGKQTVRVLDTVNCPERFQGYCKDGIAAILDIQDYRMETVGGDIPDTEGGYVLEVGAQLACSYFTSPTAHKLCGGMAYLLYCYRADYFICL